jgi:hypothetical protein
MFRSGRQSGRHGPGTVRAILQAVVLPRRLTCHPGWRGPSPDTFHHRHGLRIRLNVEFLAQQARAGLELLQRLDALSGPRETFDQQPVCGFIQSVELYQSGGNFDARRKITCRHLRRRQPAQ